MNNRRSVKPTSTSRLKQDYLRLKRDPVPYITAEPLPSNILEWHYVVCGPEDSPYFGGYYHGTLVFPMEFPFKPPAIYMLTPNGRFRTNMRLCLSISDYHPDTWNPAWSVSTILTGLLSFMLETTPTHGSTECSQYDREQYARASIQFNLKNEVFCELFPDITSEMQRTLNERKRDIRETITNGATGSAAAGAASLWPQTPASASDNNNNGWQSLASNVLVLVGFGIFAMIVNFVIKNLNQE